MPRGGIGWADSRWRSAVSSAYPHETHRNVPARHPRKSLFMIDTSLLPEHHHLMWLAMNRRDEPAPFVGSKNFALDPLRPAPYHPAAKVSTPSDILARISWPCGNG